MKTSSRAYKASWLLGVSITLVACFPSNKPYSIETIQQPSVEGGIFHAMALAEDGAVAGKYGSADSAFTNADLVVYQQGQYVFREIVPVTGTSHIFDFNINGDAAGTLITYNGSFTIEGFIDGPAGLDYVKNYVDQGSYQDSYIISINDQRDFTGLLVVNYPDTEGLVVVDGIAQRFAPCPEDYQLVEMSKINNNGSAVGYCLHDQRETYLTVIYKDGDAEVLTLTESNNHVATDINNLGIIAGNFVDQDGNSHGFLYDIHNQQLTDVGIIGVGVNFTGINDGGLATFASDSGAYIYDASNGLRLIEPLLQAGDWQTIDYFRETNEAGQILASGTDKHGEDQYYLISPEPGQQ